MSTPTKPARGAAGVQEIISGVIAANWREAVKWAKRGDPRSLAKLLRGTMPLQDDVAVRAFLADIVEKMKKGSRGRKPARPELTWRIDDHGRMQEVDTRDIVQLEIRKWIRENRPKYGKDVFEEAEKKFKEVFSRPVPKKKKRRSTKEPGVKAANLAGRSSKARKRARAALNSPN